jgi:hypothetical protein
MRDLEIPAKCAAVPGGPDVSPRALGAGALLVGDARYDSVSSGASVFTRGRSSTGRRVSGGFGGGMQRMSSVPVALFAAVSMLVVSALSGCAGLESDSGDEAVDEVSASIVEADELAVEELGEGEASDAASRALDPFAPHADEGGAALPSPGDLRAEPEPDPWNPGGDPTKKVGPNDV